MNSTPPPPLCLTTLLVLWFEMVTTTLSPSLLCVLLLVLVLLSPPTFGADVTLSANWSAILQQRIVDIDKNTILSESVRTMINSFESLNPPARETPDNKWVDLLAQNVAGLMESRAIAAKKLAMEVERLYSLNVPPSGTYNSHMQHHIFILIYCCIWYYILLKNNLQPCPHYVELHINGVILEQNIVQMSRAVMRTHPLHLQFYRTLFYCNYHPCSMLSSFTHNNTPTTTPPHKNHAELKYGLTHDTFTNP